MNNDSFSIGILGVGAACPEHICTNADLEKMVETSDEWIRTRTGIRERRIKASGEGASDYGAAAARIALERSGIAAEQIGLIICCTYTPDEPMPSAACRIQQKLGIVGAAAFDLNAACTGFVYGLVVAKNMLRGGMAKYALVVGVDMNSAVTDWTDRSTCVVFGDGAGAVVLGPVAEGKGLLGEMLASDGSGADMIVIPAGGSKHPANEYTVKNHDHFIKMAGNEVFKFAVKILGPSVDAALEKAGMHIDEVDFIVPHQANIRIIEAAAKRFGVPMERVLCNIDRYGNTSAGTIPMLLAEAEQNGTLRDGHVIAMVAFGAGLTWGAVVMRWGK